MSNSEIEKFIKKNIIGHIGNDLVQKGIYILKYPIKDILGGFCFEPSASDKNSIYIWWFVQPLYVPDEMFTLTFGNRLENVDCNQTWSNLDSIETIARIEDAVKKTISLIESLNEPILFHNYYNKHRNANLRIQEALIYTSIWLDLPYWKHEIENFISEINSEFDISIPWIRKIKEDIINISLSSYPRNILQERKELLLKLLNL